MMNSPYQDLGITPDATPTEIKAAYHRKLREFPAHTYPSEFKAIRAAYEALGSGKTTRDQNFLQVRPLSAELDSEILAKIQTKAIAQLVVSCDDLIRATF
jgi:curved DNA-binding protein CbpA